MGWTSVEKEKTKFNINGGNNHLVGCEMADLNLKVEMMGFEPTTSALRCSQSEPFWTKHAIFEPE
jgi:hypothetical protein